jgi:hypothetical protein
MDGVTKATATALSLKIYLSINKYFIMETNTMAPSIKNAHKDIPGNPSTAKSSKVKLNDRSNGKPLQLLSEDDW